MLRRNWRGGLGAALIVLGALCYALAFPPLEFAPLGWLAFLCWLAAIGDRPGRWRFYGMLAGGFIVAALGLCWLTAIFGILASSLWLIFAGYFAVWGALQHLAREQPRWLRLSWPAVLWCALELIKGEHNPLRFSWLSLGYSQINWLGFSLASCVGVYGVSLLMVLWATLMLECIRALRRERNPRLAAAMTALLAVPLLACIPAGEWTGPAIGTVRLQQFSEEQGVKFDRAAQPDAAVDLIVWPEYCFHEDPAESGLLLRRTIQTAARESRWGMIAGAIRNAPGDGFYDTAFFFDPAGRVIGSAGKNQPIQLMQDGLPAEDVTVLERAVADGATSRTLRLGIGVCYDGSYQQFARRMAQRGAQTLVFPVMNAQSWGAMQHTQHQRLFQFRGAETQLPVLVSAFSGPTFVAQPNGAAGETLPYHQAAYIDVPIHAAGRRTLFLAGGWLIAPLSLALTVLLLAKFICWDWLNARRNTKVPLKML